MEKFNLTAGIRTKEDNNKYLRKDKKIPAIVYGKNQEPISLVLDYSDFLKTFRKAGESSIITLNIAKKNIEVVVHKLQKEPVTGDFMHIDFYALTRGETLATKVHLNFIGESEAVKLGGILEELHKEIEVRCLPRDLVEHFDVDISVLKEIGENIKVGDLNLGEQYEILTPADEVIVLVQKPKKIEEETPVEETTAEGEEEAGETGEQTEEAAKE